MSNVGNRVYTKVERPDKALVEGFRGIPSSNIGDMMQRLYCMREYIKPMGKKPLAGTAFTVKVPDGDNAFLHRALDLAESGDVIVIDGGGCTTRSLCGEIMFTYAMNRGIEGFVVDGAIRDVDSLEHLDFSVYAAGVTPQGPYKNGAGEINVPVSCGGQVVCPGDILVGDMDGICVIPKNEAERILDLVKDKFAYETELLKQYHTTGIDSEKHTKTYVSLLENLKTEYHE